MKKKTFSKFLNEHKPYQRKLTVNKSSDIEGLRELTKRQRTISEKKIENQS